MTVASYKVVSTAALRRAGSDARWHSFRFALDEGLGRLLAENGHHTLGLDVSAAAGGVRDGVAYYRVRALLALHDAVEPTEAVLDVPVACWEQWEDGEAVVARLKKMVAALSGVAVEVSEVPADAEAAS